MGDPVAGTELRRRGETPVAVDVVIGAAATAVTVGAVVSRFGWQLARPAVAVVARPPFVPVAYHPASLVPGLRSRGWSTRRAAERELVALLDRWVPLVVAAVLDRIDLTALVLRRVDLDAVIESLDLTRIVIENVALDAVVERVDLEAVVRRLDLDQIVAGVDIEAILNRVDVNEIAERVSIDAVIDRIDLIGLTSYVLDSIDLPEIIRESTGSVASETVRGVRMQSIDADQAVQRAVDRLLLRRKPRLAKQDRAELTASDDPSGENGTSR